ncbi:hypothetical protein ABZ820_22100 [Streptomyces diacarni]|uniref:hypothetical protein n=1 Tax=Streptomyces diacarni TaxID=2800381 RepID=UPI0033F16533
MKKASPKAPQLTPEEIRRAADYVELVWRYQDSEQERVALEAFHADGPELARLVGEFGTLLLASHLSAVSDEHTDCEAGVVLGGLVAVTSRYLKRWCLAGGEARAAWSTAGFLIECMQEVDQVDQFLADIRGGTGWLATA